MESTIDTPWNALQTHIKEIDNKLTTLMTAIEKQNCTIDGIQDRDKTQVNNKEIQQNQQNTEQTALNYTQAMQQGLNQVHASVISQVELKTWQIIVDKEITTNCYPMACLSEKEIVAKVIMGINLIGDLAQDRLADFCFSGAKKLCRGAVILVLSTEEAAMWIKREEKMGKFMETLGGSTFCFHLQNYPVLTIFIPTTFDNNNLALQELEHMTNLKQGNIVLAKWIKPPHRCNSRQQSGHMILVLWTPEAANLKIKKWLYIKGKQVKVTKLTAEPQRCMKCQKIDTSHIAAE